MEDSRELDDALEAAWFADRNEQKFPELRREVELARIDIDKPRPQFWIQDQARYARAIAALQKAEGL